MNSPAPDVDDAGFSQRRDDSTTLRCIGPDYLIRLVPCNRWLGSTDLPPEHRLNPLLVLPNQLLEAISPRTGDGLTLFPPLRRWHAIAGLAAG